MQKPVIYLKEDVDPVAFWQEKKAHYRFISRYKGVVFFLNGPTPTWRVRAQVKTRYALRKSFPFSIEGERLASLEYISYYNNVGRPLPMGGRRKKIL